MIASACHKLDTESVQIKEKIKCIGGIMVRPKITDEQLAEIRRKRYEWRALGPVGRTQRFVDQRLPTHPEDAREVLAILRTEQLRHADAFAALRLLRSVLDHVYVTGPGPNMAALLSAQRVADEVLATDGMDKPPKPGSETPP